MDLRIFTEPQQGASHDTMLAVARATREHGFTGFFRSDHVLAMGGDGLPGPSESLLSLAAIAAVVPDIRLGTLVTSATFRHPSMLAIAAANLDEISGGRLDLGLGSGWFEAEHTAYGLPFGSSFGERFDRLTEQLQILTGLWGTPVGSTFDHDGTHFRLAGAPGLPKPVQTAPDGRPGVPLIIGGSGPKRTPALAAQFASDYNSGFKGPAEVGAQVQRVRAACGAIDRDPDTVVYSAALTVVAGSAEAELHRRAAAIGRDPQELAENGLIGTPDRIVARIEEYAAVGISRVYLQILDLGDLDHLALLGTEVLPHLR